MNMSPLHGEYRLPTQPGHPAQSRRSSESGQTSAPDSVTLSGSAPPVPNGMTAHVEKATGEEVKPSGLTGWLKRAAACAMAAVSVAGALAFPAPASALPPLPVGPDSSVSVVMAKKSDAGAATANSIAAERKEKDSLVDAMLGRAASNSTLSPKTVQKIRNELSSLPVDVLRAVDRNETRIVVLREGQSLADAGVVAPLDMKAAYGDVQGLKIVVDGALREVEEKYDAKIAGLDAEIARASAAYKRSGAEKDYQVMSDLQAKQLAANLAKNEAFNIEIYERTGGRVERHMVLSDDPGNAFFGGPLSLTEVSLDEMADLHGARTPAEKKEFIELVRALNGERLTAAQQSFKAEYEKFYPDVPRWETLSETARPFMARDERIAVPAYYYSRADGGSTASPILLSSHDRQAVGYWKSGLVSGQYFYQGDVNTVVVPESRLGKGIDGHSVIRHEMGHAYEDALMQLDPAAGRDACSAINAAFERLGGEDGKGFPSEYASSNPSELFAESLATRYGERPDALKKLDPQWAKTVDGIAGAASRAAKSTRKASPTLICPYNPYETPSK